MKLYSKDKKCIIEILYIYTGKTLIYIHSWTLINHNELPAAATSSSSTNQLPLIVPSPSQSIIYLSWLTGVSTLLSWINTPLQKIMPALLIVKQTLLNSLNLYILMYHNWVDLINSHKLIMILNWYNNWSLLTESV